MVVPNSLGRLQEAGQYPRPGEHAGWLGRRYNPVTTQVNKKSLKDNPYWRECTDEELTYQIAGMHTQDGITLDRSIFHRVKSVERTQLPRAMSTVADWPRRGLRSIEKLSRSERVKQVFVRHTFRYWMGRNETINDAPVLQDAYKAYEESGGSMEALLISLLTSDAFLYRKVE